MEVCVFFPPPLSKPICETFQLPNLLNIPPQLTEGHGKLGVARIKRPITIYEVSMKCSGDFVLLMTTPHPHVDGGVCF